MNIVSKIITAINRKIMIASAKPKPPDIGMTGEPIHLNLPTSNPRGISRNLARLATCLRVMKEEKSGERYESFKAEAARRLKVLEFNNIPVPYDIADIEALARKTGG